MARKNGVSKGFRVLRRGVKQGCSKVCGALFGKYSFPLFGIPNGLADCKIEKQIIYSKNHLHTALPKTIEPEVFWRFKQIHEGMDVPEQGVFTLCPGTATHSGGNLTSQGKLMTTFLQPSDGKPAEKHDLFYFSSKRFSPRIFKAKTPIVSLCTCWQGAFYHWIYEVLPRLHLVESAGHPLEALYVETTNPFQKQSLELMGISPDQIINAGEFNAIQAPKLIISSIPQTPLNWSCAFLRETIIPKLEKRSPIRLYVSRRDASRRRILNEDAVFSVLKQHGFQKVELSTLSFKQQAELFYAAEAVVGPHGAGFSHLAFCQPGTNVLEIFDPGYVVPCYWHVADRCQLNYHYLFGEGKRYPDFTDPHIDPDIEVDLNKLKASFELMNLSSC